MIGTKADTPISRRKFALMPFRVSTNGLVINQDTQAYNFERNLQRRAASYISSNHRLVCNIGYGLGFAHNFLCEKKANYLTLELNKNLFRRAKLLDKSCPDKLICTSWQEFLQERAHRTKFDAFFFDAFPTYGGFEYSKKAILDFVLPYFAVMRNMNTDQVGYVLLFHRENFVFPFRNEIATSLVFSIGLCYQSHRSTYTRASLFSLRLIQ